MRTCGRPDGELVPEPARKMITEAVELMKYKMLDRVVFRVSPLVEELPLTDGIERYFSPVGAEEVIVWQDRQIETICVILGKAGEHAEKFEVEILDWCQFKNRSQVPTRFEGQLGSQEAAYISRRVYELTGVPLRWAFSSEHHLMRMNYFDGCEDLWPLENHRWQPEKPSEAQLELADRMNVWCEKGKPMVSIQRPSFGFREAYQRVPIGSLQLGVSIRATVAAAAGQMIGTHQPLNPWHPAEQSMLRFELKQVIEAADRPDIVICASVGASLKFGPPDRVYSDWGPLGRPSCDEAVKIADTMQMAGLLWTMAETMKLRRENGAAR